MKMKYTYTANLHGCRQRFATKKSRKTNMEKEERQIICECNEWIEYIQKIIYNGNVSDECGL